MRYEMRMPDLATTGSDVRIIRWHVRPGQAVRRGSPLLEVETDKATMDVECVVDGVMTSTIAKPEDAVGTGQVIAILEVAEGTPAAATEVVTSQSSSPAPAVADNPPRRSGGMFARNKSAKHPAVADPGGQQQRPTRPMSLAQRTAAHRLTQSKQQIPHFYLQSSANASAMISRRKAAEPTRLAWDAFFAWAVYRALLRFDTMTYRVEGDALIGPQTDAIGVAVDHEGDLFVVPVTPASKTPEEISAELLLMVDRLRSGDPETKRIHPCLMTVTNLGAFGVESFIPIINPPEAAILGIGKISPVAVGRAEGRIGVEQRVTLTLSVDHRVVSGRYAAEFLAAIVGELESL